MGKYIIQLSKRAVKDLQIIKKSGKKQDKEKVDAFFLQLENDPRKGGGSPEPLKYYEGDVWSRELNKKDRLVYEIFESEKLVVIVQVAGHYRDK
ncbi:MAG TPA: Txe/YoeB family addiction module toxin [Porphyromonadaceae bacterium]|jgi:toxin YoeB|uniref:Txe/YoeB family addiction module toxin n=1 Tax=Limibacterium fermenti TaxID=3229863 RepID=UPI000E947BB6|nr:Txe/YoeB family addiction module toxin [Porphyromonadaceae bacterium]